MRLWYQETVMDRKQSWGGARGLSLPLQSHPRCLPSNPATHRAAGNNASPCGVRCLTSCGSMSAMDLAWTASKSSSSSARARRPPSLSRSGPGGSSKKRRFQRVSRRQCPPASLTSWASRARAMPTSAASGGNRGAGPGASITPEASPGLPIKLPGASGSGGSLDGFRNLRMSAVSLGKSSRWLVSTTKN